MCPCPTTWSKVRGRWRRYSESTGRAILALVAASIRRAETPQRRVASAPMVRPRGALFDWLAAAVIGGLVFAWLGHAFLNYDTFYALLWGSDLAHGRAPDLSVPVAPTPHPLATLLGIVLTPFGDAGQLVWVALAFLALGALAWLTFEIGAHWFGPWAGAVAALVILTRIPVLSFGVRAYVDIPYVAFVLGAILAEARRERAAVDAEAPPGSADAPRRGLAAFVAPP